MSKLTYITKILAYEDSASHSNPTRKPISWDRSIQNWPVEVPATNEYWISASDSITIVDGTRSTSIDGTTAFSIALNNQDPTRYRITNTGGTAPVFRTPRSVPVAAVQLTLTVLANLSVTVLAGSGAPFGSVQVGDIVFIKGVATGDGSTPFNSLNVGYWTVLAQSSTQITIARAPGQVFEGASEVVTPAANSEFIVYSASGIQVSDMVDISAGFSVASQKTYEVLAVTPTWIEILSTLPLGAETGITPTAAGMQFYSSAKSFIYIETDQDCVIRFNGDTGNTNRVAPIIAGDDYNVGHCGKTGPVWKCDIVNRSTVTAKLTVLSAE